MTALSIWLRSWRPRTRITTPGTLLILLGAALSVLSGILISGTGSVGIPAPELYVVFAVLTAVVFYTIISELRRGANPVDPIMIFSISYLVNYTVAPIAHWTTGLYPHQYLYGDRSPESLMAEVLLAALVCFLAPRLGYRIDLRGPERRIRNITYQIDERRL